jgi:uncharacterized protein YjbI with pentapeptide repeats
MDLGVNNPDKSASKECDDFTGADFAAEMFIGVSGFTDADFEAEILIGVSGFTDAGLTGVIIFGVNPSADKSASIECDDFADADFIGIVALLDLTDANLELGVFNADGGLIEVGVSPIASRS